MVCEKYGGFSSVFTEDFSAGMLRFEQRLELSFDIGPDGMRVG